MSEPCPKFYAPHLEGDWVLRSDDKTVTITPQQLMRIDAVGLVDWQTFIHPRGTFLRDMRCIKWPMINGYSLAFVGAEMEFRPWHHHPSASISATE